MNKLDFTVPSFIVHGIGLAEGETEAPDGEWATEGTTSNQADRAQRKTHRNLRAAHLNPTLRQSRASCSGADAAGYGVAKPPPLRLYLDVMDKDWNKEDDLIGSLPLWPLFEGGARAGRKVGAALKREDGQLGGHVSFCWRLMRSSEMIDMWPSLGVS